MNISHFFFTVSLRLAGTRAQALQITHLSPQGDVGQVRQVVPGLVVRRSNLATRTR